VLTIGLSLMLLEDSLNIRHEISFILSNYFYSGEVGSLQWRRSNFRSMIEISIYSIIGTIMTVSFIIIYFRYNLNNRGRKYFIIGYGFYFFASVASATRNIFDWYTVVGGILINTLAKLGDPDWSGDTILYYSDTLGFWFMDFVIEESLELLGATFILCSLIVFWDDLKCKKIKIYKND